jgi:hypothetical protein
MAEFRCYCLHDDGRIALGEHIEADDLSAAISNAYEYCHSHPTRAYRVIAHPASPGGWTDNLAANTNWRTARTEAWLAFAVLTTERKAA